jgi:hypothetical protein
MPNNFLQWNPSKVNQEDDTEYAVDGQRLGGADLEELFPSETANKLFYQVTTMVAGIGQMMSNKGYTMSDANFANLVTALANILTKADFGDAAGTVCQGNDPRLGSFAAGTRAWFGNTSAPTGWTIDATAADGLLAARGGTNAYVAAAGGQAGTWTQPNHLHTGPSHTHTGPSHTHTGPSHTHTIPRDGWGANGGFASGRIYTAGEGTAYRATGDNISGAGGTGVTGAGGTGVTGAGGTGNTGASATAATWRPLANLGNVCIKS